MTKLKCPVCGEKLKMITEGSLTEGGETINMFYFGCPKDETHLKLFETENQTKLQSNINALSEYAEKIASSNYKLVDLVSPNEEVSKLFDTENVSDIDTDYTISFNLPQPVEKKTKQDTIKEIIEMSGRKLTLKEIAVAIYRLKDTAERFSELYKYLLIHNSTTDEMTAICGFDRLSSLLYGMGTTHGLAFYINGTYGFPENKD